MSILVYAEIYNIDMIVSVEPKPPLIIIPRTTSNTISDKAVKYEFMRFGKTMRSIITVILIINQLYILGQAPLVH